MLTEIKVIGYADDTTILSENKMAEAIVEKLKLAIEFVIQEIRNEALTLAARMRRVVIVQ